MTPLPGAFIGNSNALQALTRPENRLIMIVGGSDSGKTTLVESLVDFLSQRVLTGIVDLDMGQSHIGPPTTIAWGKVKGGFPGWERIETEDCYFTGTTTPAGSMLPALAGAGLMTEKALTACKKVIVDTTGLISESAGRVLKQLKIDLLCPDIVLALERSGELAPVLDAFRFQKHPEVHRLPVSEGVKTKTAAERGQYRFDKMKRYLAHSRTLELSLEDVGIRFTREPLHFSIRDMRNRIVSFRDAGNLDIGLGFIEDVVFRDKRLIVRTPVGRDADFTCLLIGKAEIDRENSLLVDRR